MKTAVYSFVASIATVSLLSACSRTVTGGDGSAVTVSGDGTKISLKSGDGKTTVNGSMNQDYPSSFPVPQYPGSKISTNMAVNTTAGGAATPGAQTIIMLNTKDQPSQIIQFYKDKLSSGGWKIDSSVDTPGAGSFVAASKDTSKLNVSVMASSTDTVISLTLQ